jgi:hypothetical protein
MFGLDDAHKALTRCVGEERRVEVGQTNFYVVGYREAVGEVLALRKSQLILDELACSLPRCLGVRQRRFVSMGRARCNL